MTNVEITSNYLNQKFEVELTETLGEDNVTLIPHDKLEHILLHEIPKELGTRYDIALVYTCESPIHFIAKCTITDDQGMRVSEFGECTAHTLSTETSKDYPVTMAMTRAFDRAVVRYLDFPAKCLDKDGNALNNPKSIVAEPTKEEKEKIAKEKEKIAEQAAPIMGASKPTKTADPAPSTTATPAATPADKTPAETEADDFDQAKFDKISARVLTQATWKGMTIGETYKAEKAGKKGCEWLTWMSQKYKYDNSLKEDIQYFLKHVAAHG